MPEINPPFEWDVALWRRDPKVTVISALARGIYREFLDVMHESDRSGVISGTREELARLGRCSPVELDQTIYELGKHKTADITERNGVVTIVNRKMRREYKAREQRRNRVAAFRSARPCNAPVTTAPLIRADKGDKALSSLSDLTEKGSGEKPLEQTENNDCNALVIPEKRGDNVAQNTNNHRHMRHNCAPMKRPCNASVTRRKLTDHQRELADRFEIVLGAQWLNDAGKWVNRIKQTFGKSERVVAEVESALTESRIKTTPAQYAEQIWKEFT